MRECWQNKLKTSILIVLCLFSNKIISQEPEKNVNPKDKWYFGAEVGTNKINSFSNGGNQYSFQGGVLAEFYFARHWSWSFRVKYFETGVSFNVPGSLGYYSGNFDGAVLLLPIDLKWEFRVYKNLGAGLKLGFAPTIETESHYSNYSNTTPNSGQLVTFNYGFGLNYFMNKNLSIYTDFEYYIGESKGESPGFFGDIPYNTENRLINFGIKYHFEK